MSFDEIIKSRYSVRKYKTDKVSDEDVGKILEAGRIAPTAHNNQPQRIIVVKSDEGLALLKKCTECHYNAPLAFIVCEDSDKAWVREYDGKPSGDVDGSIVTTHMMLKATDLGLGTTWIGYFIPEAVETEFELPKNTHPVAILLVGYSDANPSPLHTKRSDISDFVTFR